MTYCIAGNFQREKFLEIFEKTNDFWKYISKYSLFLMYLEMVLLKYFMLKRHNTMKTSLPDASGPLAITMPSGSITVANLVKCCESAWKAAETKKLHGEYQIASYIHIILSEYICTQSMV